MYRVRGVHGALRRAALAGLILAPLWSLPAAADDIDGLVDPTRPLMIAVPDDGKSGGLGDLFLGLVNDYTLSSVLIRNEDRIAVINDQRVRVGDVVGTARVRSIEPRRVVLDQDGEDITLELYSGSIKTLVKQDGQ